MGMHVLIENIKYSNPIKILVVHSTSCSSLFFLSNVLITSSISIILIFTLILKIITCLIILT